MVMLKHRQSAFEGYRGLLGTYSFQTPAWDFNVRLTLDIPDLLQGMWQESASPASRQ